MFLKCPRPVCITGSAASPLPSASCRWVIRACCTTGRGCIFLRHDAQSPPGSAAPRAPPAWWDVTWGHQPQTSGHALGVQAAYCDEGRGLAPYRRCLPRFVMLPMGFRLQMFAGHMLPRLLNW